MRHTAKPCIFAIGGNQATGEITPWLSGEHNPQSHRNTDAPIHRTYDGGPPAPRAPSTSLPALGSKQNATRRAFRSALLNQTLESFLAASNSNGRDWSCETSFGELCCILIIYSFEVVEQYCSLHDVFCP